MTTLLKTFPWRTCDLVQSNRLVILSSCANCQIVNAPHAELTTLPGPRCLMCGYINEVDPSTFQVGDWIGCIDLGPNDARQVVGHSPEGNPMIEFYRGHVLAVHPSAIVTNRIGLRHPPLGLWVSRPEDPTLLQVVGYSQSGVVARHPHRNGFVSVSILHTRLHYHCHRDDCPNPICTN